MYIIEIAPLSNGAHRNQTYNGFIPDGWAILPDGIETNNFPFGEIVVKDSIVTEWQAGKMPDSIEKSPAEKRENAYNTERIVEIDGKLLTVTEASQLWQYYASEGSDKANIITDLISNAKEKIREVYKD